MRIAGYVLLVSSALHVLGVALAGFAPETLVLLLPAVFYLALCAGVTRGMIWVAWIAFICMLGGAAGALNALFGAWPIPPWIFWGIFAADMVAALLLFAGIWSGRSHRNSEA